MKNPKDPKDLQSGTSTQLGEPEFVDRLPVRSELTVLSADNPQDRTIGFTFELRDGGEVTRPNSENPLTNEYDLKEGDVVWVPTIVGIVEMTVVCDGKKLYGETERSWAPLEFAKDDRKCWTSNCLFNKKVKKLIMKRQ